MFYMHTSDDYFNIINHLKFCVIWLNIKRNNFTVLNNSTSSKQHCFKTKVNILVHYRFNLILDHFKSLIKYFIF